MAGWDYLFWALGAVLGSALDIVTTAVLGVWSVAVAVVSFCDPRLYIIGLALATLLFVILFVAVVWVVFIPVAAITIFAVILICVAFYFSWIPHCVFGLPAFLSLDASWFPFGGPFFVQHTLVFWTPLVLLWIAGINHERAEALSRERQRLADEENWKRLKERYPQPVSLPKVPAVKPKPSPPATPPPAPRRSFPPAAVPMAPLKAKAQPKSPEKAPASVIIRIPADILDTMKRALPDTDPRPEGEDKKGGTRCQNPHEFLDD